ncbi:MAG: hypothetical protein EG825_00950, partial [Rhodocyclaceae bacterium]|nr:hypothetical protein [Rhodocyclaceae bacterium]
TATTCSSSVTGPTLVATCTSAAANSSNSYTATICGTATSSNTPVASCTSSAASSSNSYTATICVTVNTGPTGVAACTSSAANSSNAWTATTCSTVTTGPTGVASCTSAAANSSNSYTTTTCPTPVTTGPTPVASCTTAAASSSNSYITTTCPVITTAASPVASCTTATASSSNSYTATTCPTVTTGPTGAAACSSAAADSSNSYTATTCSTVTTAASPVASCSTAAASSSNSYTATTCPTVTTGPSGVTSCTTAASSSSNSYTATNCTTTTTAAVPVASCTTAAASSSNSYTATTCPTSVTGPVAIATCTTAAANSSNSYTNTTCATTTVAASPIAVCSTAAASSGNSWTTTTCSSIVTGPTAVATCSTAAASSSNSYTATTCSAADTGPTAVASCSSAGANSANSYTTTTCIANNTGPTGAPTCSTAAADSSNAYTATTCTQNNTTDVPVASCTTAVASSSNSWTTVTCPTPITTGPTTTLTCPTCDPTNALAAGSSCTDPATGANSYISTTCDAYAGQTPQYQTQTQLTRNDYNGTCMTFDTDGNCTVYDNTFVVGTSVGAWSAWSAWTDMGVCSATPDPIPAGPYPQRPSPTDPASPSFASFDTNCTGWPCDKIDIHPDNSARINTLADVAQYYYKTDLRPAGTLGGLGIDVSPDIVQSAGKTIEEDLAKWQHMTTYTIGLGVSGYVPYNQNYGSTLKLGNFTALPADAGYCTTNPTASICRSALVDNLPKEPFQQIRCRDGSGEVITDQSRCLDWTPPNPTMAATDYATPAAERIWNNTQASKRVDDLWHTAVNGRGLYFNASNPNTVLEGLKTALNKMEEQPGAGTGATTSTQLPVPGDDLTFEAGFTTLAWTGDIIAKQIYTAANLEDVNLALEGTTLSGSVWSASTKLSGRVADDCDTRNIYLFRSGATNNMVPFTWNTKTCGVAGTATDLNATEQAYFTSTLASGYATPFPMTAWGQFVDMTATQKTLAQGENLVNFLRGQRGMEGGGVAGATANQVFRPRTGVLGDIINSQPVYLAPPRADFTDDGYALFKAKTGIVHRPTTLFAGANDGMLHAFHVADYNNTTTPYGYTPLTDTQGGQEIWAFIPSLMLPKMYRLASSSYTEPVNHTYFVDGTPTVGDVYDKNANSSCGSPATLEEARDCWKTVLIGGLGAGGRGYYALDVTNPNSPKALWEFNWSDGTCYDSAVATTHSADCHIGLTFGKPLITKLPGGRWVALVTSGMNNTNTTAQTGDGQGYLYVLDVITGKIIFKIGTGQGSATDPAGFAYVNAYVENFAQDNTSLRVYGGDLLGNVWRIELPKQTYSAGTWTTTVSPKVALLATLKDASGTKTQPITTRPQLMDVGPLGVHMVYVGTGRYLTNGDPATTDPQTVYALPDDLNRPTAANPSDPVLPVNSAHTLREELYQVTLSDVVPATTPPSRKATIATGTHAIGDGWYVDLPESGERVIIDMRLILGTLQFTSNVSAVTECDTGGSTWKNFLDATTGGEVTNSPFAAGTLSKGRFVVGVNYMQTQSGRVVMVVTYSDASQEVVTVPVAQSLPLGKRIGWRDLLSQ